MNKKHQDFIDAIFGQRKKPSDAYRLNVSSTSTQQSATTAANTLLKSHDCVEYARKKYPNLEYKKGMIFQREAKTKATGVRSKIAKLIGNIPEDKSGINDVSYRHLNKPNRQFSHAEYLQRQRDLADGFDVPINNGPQPIGSVTIDINDLISTRAAADMTPINTPQLVAKKHLSPSTEFVNNKTIFDLGATITTIPNATFSQFRFDKQSTFEWLNDGEDLSATVFTANASNFEDAKLVGTHIKITRRLMLQMQSGTIDLIYQLIKEGLKRAISKGVLLGGQTGYTKAMTGLFENTDIKTKDFVSATAPTFAELVNNTTDIIVSSNVGQESFVLNKGVYQHAATTERFAGGGVPILDLDAQTCLGKPFIVEDLGANAFLFGNFAELEVFDLGGVRLTTYQNQSRAGGIEIYCSALINYNVKNNSLIWKAATAASPAPEEHQESFPNDDDANFLFGSEELDQDK